MDGLAYRRRLLRGQAGVVGMVRAMALDFADKGVRVNAVAPEFIETELAIRVAHQEPAPGCLGCQCRRGNGRAGGVGVSALPYDAAAEVEAIFETR